MEYLPPDIQSKILSYIPLEYVLSCKLVSKNWESLLSHRKIAIGLFFSVELYGVSKLRFGYYNQVLKLKWSDPDEQDDEKCFYKKLTKIKHPISREERHSYTACLIGSCNGLVCLFSYSQPSGVNSSFCVLNPVTGEYFNLPAIDRKAIKTGLRIVTGFGYNASHNNYKIVRIQYPVHCSAKDKGSVLVYTLGGGDSSGWRDLGEINYQLCSDYDFLQSGGILWNGSLHWLDQYQPKIVAFGLEDEQFRYFSSNNKHTTSITELKLLGGYLSIVSVGYKRIHIWSFKNDQQKNDDIVLQKVGYESWNWNLEYSIPTFPSPPGRNFDRYKVFAITKNNEVLLWHKTYLYDASIISPILLCRYDPKTNTLNKVLHWESDSVCKFHGIPHVNSLVSLKALGIDSTSTTEVAVDCDDRLGGGREASIFNIGNLI